MIIYNITCSVDIDVADEWLLWIKNEHIPPLLKSGLFENYKMLKVLSHDDDKTLSFALQFYAKGLENIEAYHHNDEMIKRYGDKVLTYPTLLEEA